MNNHELPRRQSLKVSVSALCNEAGFTNAQESALETLTEILQSYITEIGKSSKSYAELAGRTQPMLSDVSIALVEMGVNIAMLSKYKERSNHMIFVPPTSALPMHTPQVLHVGEVKKHPSHIADHLPGFPDPHSYVKTQTHKKPVTEYQILREKAASQKRNVELALTRFIAKTGETESLFDDDPYAFPLIACKAKDLPYLEALLPNDQDLEALDEESFQQKKPKPREKPKVKESVEAQMDDSQTATGCDNTEADGQIDNPYLREIKMPILKGAKKTKYGYLSY